MYIGVLYVHALYAFPQCLLNISIGYQLPPAGEIEENRWTFNDLDWVAGKKYLLLDKKPGVSGPDPEKWLVENGFP